MAGVAKHGFPEELDFLAPDLAGKVRDLQNYEFVSSEARAQFEQLMDELRQEVAQSYFNEMSGAMQNITPESMQRMKDMMSELNQLLDKKNKGTDTQQDFEQFMEKFGDFFPENPENLDELLELMAQRMAASGMHWGEEQIEPVVALRTVLFNNDWDELYAKAA